MFIGFFMSLNGKYTQEQSPQTLFYIKFANIHKQTNLYQDKAKKYTNKLPNKKVDTPQLAYLPLI